MNGGWIDFSVNTKFAEVEYCIIAMEKNILFRCKEWFYTSVCVYVFPPPGPDLCKLGQPGVLFVLLEVLTPVFGSSFDLPLFYFHGLFPSLSFSHRHFGLLLPILTT